METIASNPLLGVALHGISIRYIGFSLTYAIAVGLSSVLGTLIPPLLKGGWGKRVMSGIRKGRRFHRELGGGDG